MNNSTEKSNLTLSNKITGFRSHKLVTVCKVSPNKPNNKVYNNKILNELTFVDI